MRKKHSRSLSSILICLLTAGLAFAQKAEPLRISFKRGATSIRLSGSLKGRQDREYVLSARHGQTLSLSLMSSPTEAVNSKIYTPGNAEIKMTEIGTHQWTAPLTQDGDYEVTVQANGKSPTCTYKLSIAIR